MKKYIHYVIEVNPQDKEVVDTFPDTFTVGFIALNSIVEGTYCNAKIEIQSMPPVDTFVHDPYGSFQKISKQDILCMKRNTIKISNMENIKSITLFVKQ